MKAKVITVTIALTVATTTFAYADGIQSPRGISQSAWSASSTYLNFQCPSGTARGEGVDMNYTTDRSDDYYFVECNPIVVYTPTPTPTPTTIASTTVSDTSTVTTVAPTTTTVTTTTNTVSATTTDTNTATTTATTTDIYAQLTALFAKIFALLALLGVK